MSCIFLRYSSLITPVGMDIALTRFSPICLIAIVADLVRSMTSLISITMGVGLFVVGGGVGESAMVVAADCAMVRTWGSNATRDPGLPISDPS